MAKKAPTHTDALARVPLLRGLTERQRSRLAKTMKERTFPAARDFIVEGHRGLGFFIIVEVSAVVSTGGGPVRTLEPGAYCGEMALIHGETRGATVTAKTELTCLTI